MKPLQTQEELDEKCYHYTKVYVCMCVAFIIIILSIVFGYAVIDTLCKYDNEYKYNSFTLNDFYADKMNNMLTIRHHLHICFNNSYPRSYTRIIRQLNEIFENIYCYPIDTFNIFELICKEKSNKLESIKINSSTLKDNQAYCLGNRDYGYGQSVPCVVFPYFTDSISSEQFFYKFPLKIDVEYNSTQTMECDLIDIKYQKILTTFLLQISNGICHRIEEEDDDDKSLLHKH